MPAANLQPQSVRSSAGTRARATDGLINETIDALTLENFSHEDGLKLWRNTMARFQMSRDRILEAEDIALGATTLTPVGAMARDKNKGNFLYLSPQRKILLLNMINALSEVAPIFERHASNDDPTVVERAEGIQDAMEALRKRFIPWDWMMARGVAQAEYATITMIAESHWEVLPEYTDNLSQAAYDTLAPKDRKGFRPITGADGTRVYSRPKQAYWRDRQGRGVEHKDYAGRSSTRTKAAYEAALDDTKAQNPPFVNRVISPLDCAPIFGTDIDGARRVRGLCVRTLMDKEPLQTMGLKWDQNEPNGKPLLIPRGFDRGNVIGSLGRLWFYEFYVWIEGDPCAAYMVGGQDTWMEGAGPDDKIPAIINLREEWGFTRLPITYPYGLNLPTDEPSERGVPYLEPLTQAILGFEGLMTSMNYTAWRRGTSKYAVTPDPKIPPAAYMNKANTALRNFDIDPDSDVVTLPGPTTMLAPLEHSGDTKFLVEAMSKEVDNATPADATAGGAQGAENGHLVNLLHTYARSSQRMVTEEGRKSVELQGSYMLEWACCFMRTKKLKYIPIDINMDADPAEGRETAITQRLELREDFIGTNYQITAKWPSQGNPVEVNQEQSLYESHLASFDDVQEKRGKTNPLRERVKIINDQYWASEAGALELNAYAAKKRGAVEQAKKLDMILSKQLTPDGQGPTAALAPQFQGQGAPGGGPPDLAELSRAGQIGGAQEAAPQNQAALATAGAQGPAAAGPVPAPVGAPR